MPDGLSRSFLRSLGLSICVAVALGVVVVAIASAPSGESTATVSVPILDPPRTTGTPARSYIDASADQPDGFGPPDIPPAQAVLPSEPRAATIPEPNTGAAPAVRKGVSSSSPGRADGLPAGNGRNDRTPAFRPRSDDDAPMPPSMNRD